MSQFFKGINQFFRRMTPRLKIAVALMYLMLQGFNLLTYKNIAESKDINYICRFLKEVLSCDYLTLVNYYFYPNPLRILSNRFIKYYYTNNVHGQSYHELSIKELHDMLWYLNCDCPKRIIPTMGGLFGQIYSVIGDKYNHQSTNYNNNISF